jgi:hypothetical protein
LSLQSSFCISRRNDDYSSFGKFYAGSKPGLFTIHGAVCFTTDNLALLFLSALRFLRDTFGETSGPLIAHLLQRNPGTWRMIVSLRKQYRKTDGLCTVTFSLPKAGVASARAVNIVSDFNGWNPDGNPMKKKKNGSFSASVTLAREENISFAICSTEGSGRTTGKPTNTLPMNMAVKTPWL